MLRRYITAKNNTSAHNAIIQEFNLVPANNPRWNIQEKTGIILLITWLGWISIAYMFNIYCTQPFYWYTSPDRTRLFWISFKSIYYEFCPRVTQPLFKSRILSLLHVTIPLSGNLFSSPDQLSAKSSTKSIFASTSTSMTTSILIWQSQRNHLRFNTWPSLN